jgi:hypothetical protein
VVHLKINTIYINAPAPGHAGGVPVRIAPEADSRAVRSEVEHSGAALAQNDLIIYAGSHPSEEGTAGHEDSDRLRFRIADLPYDLPRIGLAGWAMPPRPARRKTSKSSVAAVSGYQHASLMWSPRAADSLLATSSLSKSEDRSGNMSLYRLSRKQRSLRLAVSLGYRPTEHLLEP